MPVLQIIHKDGSKTFSLEEGRPLFIGRARECDIHLPSSAVSRRHAVVVYKAGICGVKDLGSYNGTLLNDRPIRAPVSITTKDVVRISSYVIRMLDAAPASAESGAAEAGRNDEHESDNGGSRDSAGQGILVPRAMQAEEALQKLIEDIHPGNRFQDDGVNDTQEFVVAPDTDMFLQHVHRADPSRERPDTHPPEAEPAKGALERELSDAEFAEPGPAQECPPEDKPASDEESEVPLISPEEAEAIIPMNDPAAEERLTLEGEDDGAFAADASKWHDEDLENGPAENDADERALNAGAADADGDEAEAGMDGEPFPPDDGDAQGDADDASGEPAAVSGESRRIIVGESWIGAGEFGGEGGWRGLEPIPVSPALHAAINTRLSLYSLLDDLSEERALLRAAKPNLSAEVLGELARQDAEAKNLPVAPEADSNIQAMRERHAREDSAAESAGRAQPDPEMRSAEEMAISQWMLISDSHKNALPAMYKEAYALAADEPLALEFSKARIRHGRLMGGAVCLLILEAISLAADEESRKLSGDIRKLSGDGAAGGGVFGKLGKLASNLKHRNEIRDEAARLEELLNASALRAALALREILFLEKNLDGDFRQAYLDAAEHFIPGHKDMPLSVRAFLRYGVIGLKRWWMHDAVREFIETDCMDNVVGTFERGSDGTNIVYADEYLSAVSAMECTSSPIDRLDGPEKNSLEIMADRAYRRIVNSRCYTVLMEEMLRGLRERVQQLDEEAGVLEKRAAGYAGRPGSKEAFALQSELHSLSIRKENIENYIKRIESEVVPSILDAVSEAEGRFRKGELPLLGQKERVRHEAEALCDFARHMGGQRERFLPTSLRRQLSLDNGMMNERGALRRKLLEMEELDPAIFRSVVISSKKRANRISMRVPPVIILVPSIGERCVCSMGREGMEGGHMIMPVCFLRSDMRNRQLNSLFADFRWLTSRGQAGRDVMNSDTLAGAFMRLRWDWRGQSKAKRERGLIFNENTDVVNWRRVYEMYIGDAMNGGRAILQRNRELYANIIVKYLEPPEGVDFEIV